MAASHVFSLVLLHLVRLAAADELAHIWSAPVEDVHARRLAGRRLTTLTATINVVRNDYWSASATVEVYYKDPSADKKKPLTFVFFPGTEGNKGSKMPHNLTSGMQVQLEGAVEEDATEVTDLRKKLAPPPGVAATVAGDKAGLKKDDRRIFVLNKVNAIVKSPSKTRRLNDKPRRASITDQSAGTAPAELTALAVLVHPCGKTLSVDAAAVSKAMFDETNNATWASTYKQCSRGASKVIGKAIGPIEVCPSEEMNLGATWDSVETVLKFLHADDYNAYKYKILIQPDEWQSSIGSGLLGGDISWVRESYMHEAAMHLHEVGHNMYLHHAGDGFQEYNDQSSVMGACCAPRCYHFIHSWQLGFADVSRVIDSATIPSDGSVVDVDIKELASAHDSGVTLPFGANHFVFSYRGSNGFDAQLHPQYKNTVFLHIYSAMHDKRIGMVTQLSASTTEGGTMLIPTTEWKLTWHATVDNIAKVRICHWGGNEGACGSTSAPSPAPGPTPAPAAPTWTSYFSDEEVGGEVSSQAMVGLGCKGEYCDKVKTAHSSHLRVDLKRSSWLLTDNDVADITCDADKVISRLKCKDEQCGRIMVECTPITGGKLIYSAIGTSEFEVPKVLHATEEQTCPEGSVMTSIRCGGTRCAKKFISCQKFERTQCTPADTCSALGLECTIDGCGKSCGVCGLSSEDTPGGAVPQTCLANSGRCVSTGIRPDWFSSELDMPVTGLTATGMSCRGRYCAEGRLNMTGVKVSQGYLHYSGWISDNVGARFPWNHQTDDRTADCPEGQVVTYVECRGRYCDDIRLRCGEPISWKVDPLGQPWVSENWFSEEGAGNQNCPTGFAMVGMECQKGKTLLEGCIFKCHDYCDNKKIRCRQMTPMARGALNTGIAQNKEIAVAVEKSKECDEKCRIQQLQMGAILGKSSVPYGFFALIVSFIVHATF